MWSMQYSAFFELLIEYLKEKSVAITTFVEKDST